MCMFSQQLQAQPLYVNNNSDIGNYPYDITTYLIYSRVGEVCSGADWAVPLTFEAGSMLTINDGSFVWTSPWNEEEICLGEAIGYGCEPVLLDFYGQRIESIYYNDFTPPLAGVTGMISTIAGVPCLGGPLMLGSSDNNWQPPALSGDYSVSINYDNQDPINPISFTSTINYMNWGFMQTLAFN
ncbi:hypothetical protein, partial [Avrilella dinanensis]|uniref:hypothetical protein n=1 Tax=Avrilella dinanensis TaxID=2008672 RepID=UPI00240A8698